MLVLSLLAIALLLPVFAYGASKRRWENDWAVFEPVPSPGGGAYRGGKVWSARLRGAPRLVKVAAVWSLAMGVPALLSLPLMILGVADEAERSAFTVGPALGFGVTGFALAVGVFACGVALFRRRESSRSLTRAVAVWSIAHNAAVVVAVSLATRTTVDLPPAWSDFSVHAFGWAALVYAGVSSAHAFTLLAAAAEHERADVAATEAAERAGGLAIAEPQPAV